jgi:hypothetical protein
MTAKENEIAKSDATTGDIPIEPVEDKKVSTERSVPKAGDTVFANKAKRFVSSLFGGKVSDKSVLTTDSAGSGGSTGVASDLSKNPGSGSTLDGGVNPVDKLDQRELDKYDNAACECDTIAITGTPGYQPSEEVSPNSKADDDYNLKNVSAGSQPQFGTIFRRTPLSVSKQNLLFVRGQQDTASVVGAVGKYPTRSIDNNGEADDVTVHNGNFLVKGIKFTATSGVTSNVEIITEEIPVQSDIETLAVVADQKRVQVNIAQQKVSDFTEKIDARDEDAGQRYSPIADGINQPAEHLALAEDIVLSDGAIVTAALKSMTESAAFAQMLRGMIGGGKSAEYLANIMLAEAEVLGAMSKASDLSSYRNPNKLYSKTNKSLDPTIYTLMGFESISRLTATYGSALKNANIKDAFNNALRYLDERDFMCDKDALNYLDKMFGWYKDSEADTYVGVDTVGLVLPYDPAEYFVYQSVAGGAYELDGKCHIVNMYNSGHPVISSIGSELFFALTEYFKRYILPKIIDRTQDQSWSGTFFVPFDFTTKRFSLGAFFIALALDKLPHTDRNSYINGAYKQFENMFKVNPFEDDTSTHVGSSSILNSAAFRGLSTPPVFQEAHPMLKLNLADPETIALDAQGVTEAGGTGYHVVGMMQMHHGIARMVTDEDEKYIFGMPLKMDTPYTLGGMSRVMSVTPKQYLKSRDLPVKFYNHTASEHMNMGLQSDIKDETVNGNKATVPGNFLPFYSDAGSNASIAVSALDICATRRLNGRYAPAPYACALGSKSFYATKYDKTTDPYLVVDLAATDKITGGEFSGGIKPIETYSIIWLQDDDTYVAGKMGSALSRDLMIMNTAGVDGDFIDAAAAAGYFIDVTPSYQAGVNKIASFENADHDKVYAQYVPSMASLMWIVNHYYPFFELPTGGVSIIDIEDEEAFHDDRFMLQLNEAFGLVFFEEEFFNRLVETVRGVKKSNANFILTNDVERSDNLLC